MPNAMEASAQLVIEKTKEELKKIPEIKPPAWAGLVKSGSHAERVPEEPDFWFRRAASVLLTILKRGPVGTERLRLKYGGRHAHTVSRAHSRKAGGKTIRLIMQQLEQAGLVKKEKTGRIATAKGISLLDKAAKV